MLDIFEEIGIPKSYLKETTKHDRFTAVVNKLWLKSLVKHLKLIDFVAKSDLQNDDPSWMKVTINCLKKKNGKAFPLPRVRTSKDEMPLLFSQLMQYVNQTNYINLWKKAYKKYTTSESHKDIKINMSDYNTVLKEIIIRLYGCPIINIYDENLSVGSSAQFEVHLNIFPALCAVETHKTMFLIHAPYMKYNISDCVTFSPAILDKSHMKCLFIVYQLLNVLKSLHERSLTLGEISLTDIHMNEDMWIYIFPDIRSNIYEVVEECKDVKCGFYDWELYDKVETKEESLKELSQMWINGLISNFTYISALNRFSGRVYGDPNCHYVFPWVTDFTSGCGKNWRDLKKSKYRLNKGDHQLDLTYDNSQTQVPHHVSDVLSPITYYVYMARKTPKSVLCKNVRTIWVPAEYPSSIQRIQEWSPDECIPEFYSDPSVFRSIHEDLEDLAVPSWAADPEEFIEIHRKTLENQIVSEKLHHWIDLTFGYKLDGNAAIRARNVCLNLIDDHENLTKSGLVQLFSQPHPPRTTEPVYFGKVPPKAFINKYVKPRSRGCSNPRSISTQDPHPPNDHVSKHSRSRGRSNSSISTQDPHPPDDHTNPLSRSRSSLYEDQPRTSRSPSAQRPDTNKPDVIQLPKDYKPEFLLDSLEKRRSFFLKTFNQKEETVGEVSDGSYADIISSRRIKELEVLGCVVTEIFLAKELRPMGFSNNLSQRLDYCKFALKSSEIPPCISSLLHLLLEELPVVTCTGLPPPSAHLLLEPLTQSTIPFPKQFPQLYELINGLKEFKSVALELDILYHFDCNGEMCAEYETIEKTRILFAQNIAECKVKTCARQLESLLEDSNCYIDNLLLPYVKELIEDSSASVLAVWYLFEPISRVLGPIRTKERLLEPVLKLYENDCVYVKKIAKIYHHSFLLSLIVRLGLKVFLENFVVPLVEAVGGYKDYDPVDFVLHNHSKQVVKRGSHLKIIDSEQMELSNSETKSYVMTEEIFEMEDEKTNEDQMKFLMEHLQLNVISELPFMAEEAVDVNVGHSGVFDDQFEEEVECEESLKSPTIPIPQSHHTSVSNINCEVGSKKSESELNFPKSNTKISDMSSDSLIWLSHRLGPLLTAKYLSRNLLKMLALCYIGKENLSYVADCSSNYKDISVTAHYVKGDQTSIKVLECLTSISGLYGEQIIIFQYIPYMIELILLCKKRITTNLEGGLISCLTLLKIIIPYVSDSMLMNQLQDVILKNVVHPIVRLLSSTKHAFPCGSTARNALARKYLDVLYVLSIRIGVDMTKKFLLVPAVQRFFLIFDKVFGKSEENKVIQLSPERIAQKVNCSESCDNFSNSEDSSESRALLELQEVFTRELAHTAYLPFVKLLGLSSLETALNNYETVCKLCQEYEEEIKLSNVQTISSLKLADFRTSAPVVASSSIGSNIAVIGNRIELQSESLDNINIDLLSLVSNRIENSSRHLRGNWLAYWEHEIGRSEKDVQLNFKQIKLQTFVGHTQSVKCLHILDNENSFMSGSRDKTVKLWSMRSQGDGFATSNCQWTYSCHKKSILSITFLESLRLVASCDSIVHIWDPFMGANVGILESSKFAPVNTLKSMPAPSTSVFAATTDGTLKVLDTRTLNYVQELKISSNPTSLIRCLAISSTGNWVAAGQSSGNITILDTRTGLVLANWRAHESEVLQLEIYDKETLISSSLDQNTSVWNVSDGKLKFYMRGTTEPVHCLSIRNNELISGTTGNRIGVHASITPEASFSNSKLRGDSFKGLLTSMDYMPLNRLLLLGADTGNVTLLC